MIKSRHLSQSAVMWRLLSKYFLAFGFFIAAVFPCVIVSAAEIPKGEAYIPKGTELRFKLTEEVSAQKYEQGDSVPLILLGDTCINHVTVLKAGTSANAKVTKALHSGIWGRSGQIEVKILSVDTVNGITVPLQGVKKKKVGNNDNALTRGVIGGMFIKGGKAVLRKGTVIHAVVTEDTPLHVKIVDLPVLEQDVSEKNKI